MEMKTRRDGTYPEPHRSTESRRAESVEGAGGVDLADRVVALPDWFRHGVMVVGLEGEEARRRRGEVVGGGGSFKSLLEVRCD